MTIALFILSIAIGMWALDCTLAAVEWFKARPVKVPEPSEN